MMEKAEFSGLKIRTCLEYSGDYGTFNFHAHASIHTSFDNYNRPLNGRPFFTLAERLMLTQLAISSNEEWGVDVAISSLFCDGLLKQAFGLHSRRERNALLRACSHGWWKTPL